MMKVLFLIGSCLLPFCSCVEIAENQNERNSTWKESKEGSASTLSNSNVTSYAGPRNEDVQRIITPVIITSPHLDKHLQPSRNFTGSPMLGPILTPREEYSQRQYLPLMQKQPEHYQIASKDLDPQHKEHQYSQPLPPDFFYTEQYLRSQQQQQQQKELEKYQSKPAVLPEAKHNGYGKPVKFDESDYPYTFTEVKDFSSSSELSSQVPSGNGSPHPYPFVSSSEVDMEAPPVPYRGDAVDKGSLSSKQYHSPSLPDGYPYHTSIVKHESEIPGMFKKMMNLLAAFIPLGLFLAAIPPNVITINTTQPDVPSRHRSVDPVAFSIFELLDKYGLDSLDDEACENRIFCEMSRLGRLPDANFIQKAFWHLAHDTPDKTAEQMGMRELFKAVRTDACDFYRCEEKQTAEESQQTTAQNGTSAQAPK